MQSGEPMPNSPLGVSESVNVNLIILFHQHCAGAKIPNGSGLFHWKKTVPEPLTLWSGAIEPVMDAAKECGAAITT